MNNNQKEQEMLKSFKLKRQFIEIKPTIEQISYCDTRLKHIWIDFKNNPETFQVDYYNTLWGFICETVISDIIGNPRPIINNTLDSGDIKRGNICIDVKARALYKGKPDLNYLVKIYREQLERPNHADYYIFCFYNPLEYVIWIAGITSHTAFMNVSKLYSVGDSLDGLYKIDNVSEEQYATECFNLSRLEFGKL